MKPYLHCNFDYDSTAFINALDELPLWSAPFGLSLLGMINYRKNINILDIGSCTGFPVIELALRFGDSSSIWAVDPWIAALERLKSKMESAGVKNLQIHCGIAEDLPFENGYFDLITSNNGFNNVEDMLMALQESRRVLKPGSQLVFTVNLPETMKAFYDELEFVLLELGLKEEVIKMKEHIHHKRKNVAFINDLLKKAGFEAVRVNKNFFLWQFADGTSFLNHYSICNAFMPSWKELIPERMLELVFDKVENRLNQIARDEGWLKMSIPYAVFDCKTV
jgi:ubiquinone/menaquinone biosynthesis C-methylase UbiE